MRISAVFCSVVALLALLSASGSAQQRRPIASEKLDVSSVVVALGDLDTGARARSAEPGPARFFVLLEDEGLAAYRGGISGFAPTSPGALGRVRLDLESSAARGYLGYLEERQTSVLEGMGRALGREPVVVRRLRHALSALVVELEPAEVASVAALPGVVRVERDTVHRLATDSGPALIGAPGVWDGSATGLSPTSGEGVIIGIVDSGINMDHPSFADVGADGYDHTNPWGAGSYVGLCDPGNPDYDPTLVCNDKLIGVWNYADGPGDSVGHGSHVAGTAAGNHVDGTLSSPTTTLVAGLSGVAPHGNIVSYDVCSNLGSCWSSDVVTAIDQAVADGVDVINESILINGYTFSGPKQTATLGAVAAGIVHVQAAGNSGPAPATVGTHAPWTLTVANSTHDRRIVTHLTVLTSDGGGLPDMTGSSLSGGYGPAPIVWAGDFANPNDPGGDPELCAAPYPAATFSDIDGSGVAAIVVCDRGGVHPLDMGANVLAGGAGGLVVANRPQDGESIWMDRHVLPAIHLGAVDSGNLEGWLAANSGTSAAIVGSAFEYDASFADRMATSSSRGPCYVDVVKPDVAAPGSSIWAANLTVNPADPPEYRLMSGTSMASPHVAGAVALVRALNPSWSPSEIKSALMTTAAPEVMVKEDAVTPADAFDRGAGRVEVARAAQAGMLLHESASIFAGADPYLGGTPKALNLASFQDGACYQQCAWSRTVSNPGTSAMTWSGSYQGPGAAVLTPSQLTIGPGGQVTFGLDLDVRSVAPGEWVFGEIRWTEASAQAPEVTMPVAFRVAASSQPSSFTKDVDRLVADFGEVMTYTLALANPTTLARVVDLVDPVPTNAGYVAGSATGGMTYDSVADTLQFSGTLPAASISVRDGSAPFGYFPLASLGVSPTSCPADCDDGSFTVTGIDVVFGGHTYTEAIWSVNGTLELGAASASAASPSNVHLPDASAPGNLLAPWWTDLDLGAGGNWYLGTVWSGSSLYAVFEWANVPRAGDPGSTASFQIWLERGGDSIWFSYPGGAFSGDTSDATVGAQNEDGTVGDTFYYGDGGMGTVPGDFSMLPVEFAAGPATTLTFQLRAAGPDGAHITNVATADDGVEVVEAWADTVIDLSGAEADLSLSKTGVDFGDGTGAYTLTVANLGPDDDPDVVVVDVLPAGAMFLGSDCGAWEGPPGTVTWNVGLLAVGQTASCVVQVTILDPLDTANSATASGLLTDPNPANSVGSSLLQLAPVIPSLGGTGVALLLAALGSAGLLLLLRRR